VSEVLGHDHVVDKKWKRAPILARTSWKLANYR
jgi:hypothetical protein